MNAIGWETYLGQQPKFWVFQEHLEPWLEPEQWWTYQDTNCKWKQKVKGIQPHFIQKGQLHNVLIRNVTGHQPQYREWRNNNHHPCDSFRHYLVYFIFTYRLDPSKLIKDYPQIITHHVSSDTADYRYVDTLQFDEFIKLVNCLCWLKTWGNNHW